MNNAWTAALKEAFAHNPTDVVILDTIEVTHPAVASVKNRLDLCFCVDDTGSMGGILSTVKDLAQQIADSLGDFFIEVRYALIRFKDEDDTEILTGATFTTYSNFVAQLELLVANGGGDGPENGYGAIKMGADTLDWRSAANVGKAMVLLTDISSHERGATKSQAISALDAEGIIFCYGVNADSGYDDVMDATGGDFVTNSVDFVDELVAAIRSVQGGDNGSLFLVRDRQSHTFTLEDGSTQLFEPTGFEITLPSAGNSGQQEMMISMDNVDRVITDFLDLVKGYNQPVTIIYRPYFAGDPTTLQMNPPLKLFLRDVEVDDFRVSGRAVMSDVINRKFPSQIYTRARFPSLGG